MPSSRFDVIPFVLNLVVQYQPSSILDIGCGFGKYGVLFREYLDVWHVSKPYNQRITNIVGVEAFKSYRNPAWDVYDEVKTEDILDIVDSLPPFDLVFMGDVIEHFSKESGKILLQKLKYKRLIVVTPKLVTAQQAVYDNQYEIHRSSWTIEDFPGMQCELINNQQVFF